MEIQLPAGRNTCHFLTGNVVQSADKDQQEMRAVAEKPHDAVVKFDTYRYLQRHGAYSFWVGSHIESNVRVIAALKGREKLSSCKSREARAPVPHS